MAHQDLTEIVNAREAEPLPLLVFGGPYSNIRALEAMRRTATRLAIPADRVICTGDIVAYCAEPEETVRAVRDWGCHVIAGNCEEQLAAGAADCGCGFEEGTACDLLAKGWYPFANQRVSVESRAWMATLPKAVRFRWRGLDCHVLHGGVDAVSRFIFASQAAVIDSELEKSGADLVIGGHAGMPFVSKRKRGTWFNAGVIGMPANDGTPDGWYGLLTPAADGVEISLHRLAYDARAAAAAVRRWSYADSYAKSLVTGVWPSFDVLPEPERAAAAKRLRPRPVTISAPGRRTARPAA